MSSAILAYQQKCSATYSEALGLPADYRYPSGNPIRPVGPIRTTTGGVMVVGAYPSARFESRSSCTSARRRLIPVADNLDPFGNEVYFDGLRVRRPESGSGLRTYVLAPLGLGPEECWITDLVKVFLYKPTHADGCADVFPGFRPPILRPQFLSLGSKSLSWIHEEIGLCQPKVIVTLGEEVARVVSSSVSPADDLLSAKPYHPDVFSQRTTFHCPHPDACRRSDRWRIRMHEIAFQIRTELESSNHLEKELG